VEKDDDINKSIIKVDKISIKNIIVKIVLDENKKIIQKKKLKITII
jgi:hypothetical protein